MAASNPAERKEVASIAAHARWGRRANRVTAAAPERATLRGRLDGQLPASITDIDERRELVDHALAEWMLRAQHRRRREERVIDDAIRIITGRQES